MQSFEQTKKRFSLNLRSDHRLAGSGGGQRTIQRNKAMDQRNGRDLCFIEAKLRLRKIFFLPNETGRRADEIKAQGTLFLAASFAGNGRVVDSHELNWPKKNFSDESREKRFRFHRLIKVDREGLVCN